MMLTAFEGVAKPDTQNTFSLWMDEARTSANQHVQSSGIDGSFDASIYRQFMSMMAPPLAVSPAMPSFALYYPVGPGSTSPSSTGGYGSDDSCFVAS
jgi:hypothetical protein